MTDGFPRLRALALDSRIGRSASRASDLLAAAWKGSRTSRAWRTRRAAVEAWPLSDRIATGGIAVATAAVAYAATGWLRPAYTASLLPWWWSALVIVSALAVAVGAARIATAWASRSPDRAGW